MLHPIEERGEWMGKQAFKQVKIGKENKILALEDLWLNILMAEDLRSTDLSSEFI